MKQCKIPFNNEMIYYKVMGSGHPVILIHGFAEDNEIWKGIAEALATNYKLILPNIPGSGNTPSSSQASNGMEDYAQMMLAILKTEGHDNAVVIGHSMGGYIALSMAEQQPNCIKGLGLFHSTAYADDASKKEVRQKSISFLKENGATTFLKTSIPGLFANPVHHKEEIEKMVEAGGQFSSDTLIKYYEAMMARPDRTAVLSKATFPVLFVMGLEDKAVPFSDSLQQSHLPSIGHISILRNSAHMGMIEEPEKSLLILTDFLQAIYV